MKKSSRGFSGDMDERIEYGYYDGIGIDDTDDQNEECNDLAEGHQSTE